MRPSLIYLAALVTPALSAATVVVTVPAAIPSNEPSYKDTKVFTSAILNSTNFYRAEHNASDLAWNKTLATFADKYLDEVECDFKHSGGPYGENLAQGYPTAAQGVEGWGDERNEYDFKKGEFTHETGHFTQLVWKNTSTVGCGRRLCGENGWYLVCEYWPRGNVIGEFTKEVQSQVRDENTTGSGGDEKGAGVSASPPVLGVVLLATMWAVVMA